MRCFSCEDGEGRVFNEDDRVWDPCEVCQPMFCVNGCGDLAGLDGLCARCARPASTELICEREGPVSRLLEGSRVHLVPHESGAGVFQAAVIDAFYTRTLDGVT